MLKILKRVGTIIIYLVMKKLIVITSFLILFSSCSHFNFIAPPYTNSSKIVQLKVGMTIDEVNKKLGIRPYDVYYIGEKKTILVYNYRLKMRKQKISGNYDEFVHTEASQTGGNIYYKKEGDKLFVSFKDGKMSSLITNNGRKDAEFLMLTNNNLRFITKDNLMSLQKQLGDVYLLNKNNEMQKIKSAEDSTKSRSVIVPAKRELNIQEKSETKKEKSSGNTKWWIIGGAGALVLLLLF
jgi:hypothetical protein